MKVCILIDRSEQPVHAARCAVQRTYSLDRVVQGACVRYDRSHTRLSVAARARRAPPHSRHLRPAAQPDNPQEA